MSVQPLTSFDPRQLFHLGSRSDGGIPRLDTRISGLSIAREFSGRVNVTTADGDRITLVADVDDAYEAGAIQSFVQTSRGTWSIGAGYAQSTHAHHLGVSVQGDLNEAEVTDLEKLFEKVASVFRGFLQGQDNESGAHAVHLADGFHGLENLSSLDLNVEIVRSVTVVSGSGSTPGGAPGTAAAIPQSSNGTTAPTPSPDSSDAARRAAPVSRELFAALIQQVFDALNDRQVDANTLRHHLPAFIDKLREELTGELREGPRSETADRSYAAENLPIPREATTDSQSVRTAYRTTNAIPIAFSIQV